MMDLKMNDSLRSHFNEHTQEWLKFTLFKILLSYITVIYGINCIAQDKEIKIRKKRSQEKKKEEGNRH